MSSKSSKRRRRMNTNDEESEKKPEEIIEASDDNKSTISTDTEKTNPQPQPNEENGDVTKDTKESTNTIIIIDSDDSKDTPKEPETITIDPPTEIIEPDSNVTEKTNGKSSEDTDSQRSLEEHSEEIEPLVLDVEDPELEFPSETNSDRSSEIDKSPIINRCVTRRSQTRHIPTPKTPKLIDFSSEAAEGDIGRMRSEVRVNVTRLITPEVIITPPELDEKSENDSSSMSDDKSPDLDSTNASVFVNYTRNDTNFDISTSNIEDDATLNGPSFLEKTNELSYGATLRTLTGRRGLRNDFNTTYRPRLYKSHIDLTSRDMSDGVKKYVPLTPSVASKRKLEEDIPEDYKRIKTDDSPGFLGYFVSPFKSKLAQSEIPSSTPKLTAFKFNQNDDVSHLGNVDAPTVEPRKWCSIM